MEDNKEILENGAKEFNPIDYAFEYANIELLRVSDFEDYMIYMPLPDEAKAKLRKQVAGINANVPGGIKDNDAIAMSLMPGNYRIISLASDEMMVASQAIKESLKKICPDLCEAIGYYNLSVAPTEQIIIPEIKEDMDISEELAEIGLEIRQGTSRQREFYKDHKEMFMSLDTFTKSHPRRIYKAIQREAIARVKAKEGKER